MLSGYIKKEESRKIGLCSCMPTSKQVSEPQEGNILISNYKEVKEITSKGANGVSSSLLDQKQQSQYTKHSLKLSKNQKQNFTKTPNYLKEESHTANKSTMQTSSIAQSQNPFIRSQIEKRHKIENNDFSLIIPKTNNFYNCQNSFRNGNQNTQAPQIIYKQNYCNVAKEHVQQGEDYEKMRRCFTQLSIKDESSKCNGSSQNVSRIGVARKTDRKLYCIDELKCISTESVCEDNQSVAVSEVLERGFGHNSEIYIEQNYSIKSKENDVLKRSKKI